MAARLPGVSFIIRVRDEEQYLPACLASLREVTVPHEIVVILHMCTDASKEIAQKALEAGQPIVLLEKSTPVSRAGYETLITPQDHPNSFPSHSNFCYTHSKYNWQFRWDADFRMTLPLLHFVNSDLDIASTVPVKYGIPCRLDANIVNTELYLTNAFITHTKYFFWEVMTCHEDATRVFLQCEIQSLPPTVIKTYWNSKPWFLDGVCPELEAKYMAVVGMLGPEPPGMARCCNLECDAFFHAVCAKRSELEALGISFYV